MAVLKHKAQGGGVWKEVGGWGRNCQRQGIVREVHFSLQVSDELHSHLIVGKLEIVAQGGGGCELVITTDTHNRRSTEARGCQQPVDDQHNALGTEACTHRSVSPAQTGASRVRTSPSSWHRCVDAPGTPVSWRQPPCPARPSARLGTASPPYSPHSFAGEECSTAVVDVPATDSQTLLPLMIGPPLAALIAILAYISWRIRPTIVGKVCTPPSYFVLPPGLPPTTCSDRRQTQGRSGALWVKTESVVTCNEGEEDSCVVAGAAVKALKVEKEVGRGGGGTAVSLTLLPCHECLA